MRVKSTPWFEMTLIPLLTLSKSHPSHPVQISAQLESHFLWGAFPQHSRTRPSSFEVAWVL